MKHRWTTTILAVSLTLNAALIAVVHRDSPVREARADVTPAEEDILPYMTSQLERVHKLGLAIQSRNKPLAEFYLGELEEGFEAIQKKFPTHDGVEIASLSRAMIDPTTPALHKALAASNWTDATAAYANLIAACNDCHGAADHEYIEITVPTGNPFNQSFSPPGKR